MKKILAINDQQDNLTTIKALLKNHLPDCKVLTALSGKEGLEIAEKEQPDTILLDIVMPNLDGFEVCKKLKEDESTKHIPVVMLTAIKTDSESRVRGLETGADAFLHKPIDPPELSAQIKVMLRIKAAEDKLRAEKELLDKKVEERTKELKESKERFQVALKNSPIVVWNQDKDFCYTWIHNPHPGFKPEEIIGKTDKELLPTDDAERLVKIKRNVLKNNVGTREEVQTTINGEPFYYDLTVEPLKDSSSAVIGITCASIDITERKRALEKLHKSEDRLSKVMIAVNEGMWDWNLRTNEVYFDPRYYKMSGYGVDQFPHSLEEFQKRVHPGDIENVMANAEKHLKGEIERFDVEFRFARSDGSWMWILGRGVIVERDDDGNPIRFIGTHTDINKRKQAEAELAKHRDHLEEIVKERTKELEEKNEKLKQFNKLFVDREFRIKELKDKVKEFEGKKLGEGE